MAHRPLSNHNEDIGEIIDKKLDRSGWFYLVIGIGTLLALLSIAVPYFRSTSHRAKTLEQRVIQLEQKVSELESLLDNYSE